MATIRTQKAFFLIIFSFALFTTAILFFNTEFSPFTLFPTPYARSGAIIMMWDMDESAHMHNEHATFLGPAWQQRKLQHTLSKTCKYNCTFTTDRSLLYEADAIVFDPGRHDPDSWRRLPISVPHKQPHHSWVLYSYQHEIQYPLVGEARYRALMDYEMTYDPHSDIPISLFCPWGGLHLDDILTTPPAFTRPKTLAFISSSCHIAGAAARTAYVSELMQYISVDSYGTCLHNIAFPTDKGKVQGSPLNSIEDVIDIMREYKFVLTFENINITDFVTEKVFTAFQAGTLPIYMGAPNIDDWLPGEDSVIKTSDFESPQALAEYIKTLLKDEKEFNSYFAWKNKGFSQKFKAQYARCMFEGAECRLCEKIVDSMTEERSHLKQLVLDRSSLDNSFALRLYGRNDNYVEVADHKKLRVSARYTLGLWVKPITFGDQRMVDKNKAGTITGYNFDIQAGGDGRGYIRLCAGGGCYFAKRGIYKDVWTHVVVVYSSEHSSIFDNYISFYINGVLDSTDFVFVPTGQETLPLTFGKASNTDGGAFDGYLDNIHIYDRDLSASEVQDIVFRVPVGNEADLVGYWTFDEGVNDYYAYDWSSNGYHGKVVGGRREHSIEKPLVLNKCM